MRPLVLDIVGFRVCRPNQVRIGRFELYAWIHADDRTTHHACVPRRFARFGGAHDRDPRPGAHLHRRMARRSRPCAGSTSTSRAGELVAFLGPNGAGKSTTLRMLTTLLRADRRAPRPWPATTCCATRPAVRQRIGYIGQGNGAGHNQRGRSTSWSARAAPTACRGRPPGGARPSCSSRSSSTRWPTAWSARCPAASAAASTSRWA